jgi:subtilisin family serine protease
MNRFVLLYVFLSTGLSWGATIAIIDTGFDLDHDFLKPKIFKQETDEEAIDPELVKEFHGWNFHDNSHLRTPVVQDQSSLQEILLYRNLKAKGHREGLSLDEFEWFKKKSSDKNFMELVRRFKKHSHGTFVAGIALREGENINIFPIRGLNIPSPVIAVEDSTPQSSAPIKAKSPEDKFHEELKNSLDRVSQKFSKICHYLSLRRVEVVNASYGITYKNIVTKFRESYKEITGKEIEEPRLQAYVDKYFQDLYSRGMKTIKKYPKTLFIFSAGNSGLDNDLYHHYPSKIKLPNTLSVAAMNGDFLATFSNYGVKHVDVGAPGVAILSLVPKVYSQDGRELYSPSSGTSMAAPYISNLAAQILNANSSLTPVEVKKIIMNTGERKEHLKNKLLSAAKANNDRAIKAAILSKEMPIDDAISLSESDLIPFEDKLALNQPGHAADALKKKVIDSVPQVIKPEEVDDEPTLIEDTRPATIPSSSPLPKTKKAPQDNLVPPPSIESTLPPEGSDPGLSSQSATLPPQPSSDLPASSSQSEPPAEAAPHLTTSPSSP